MKITDVRVRKVNTENRMKAVASVTFDNEFVVHDIKVIESEDGFFIAMPSRKTQTGEFRDIAHPINSEAREKIQKAVLEVYESPEVQEAVTPAKKEAVEEKDEEVEDEEEEESAE